MAESYELGRQGEELACQRLESEGCRILDTRWKLHHLELDIVATDGRSLIVAEVKTRRSRQWGEPYEAVTDRKMRNMVNATDAYMKINNVDLPYRFDLFSIVIDKSGHAEIDHIKDAFYPPLG
jgi:putative endonuclease